MAGVNIRVMTADDAGWVAGLMERRRRVYAGYSPVFWRPRLETSRLGSLQNSHAT